MWNDIPFCMCMCGSVSVHAPVRHNTAGETKSAKAKKKVNAVSPCCTTCGPLGTPHPIQSPLAEIVQAMVYFMWVCLEWTTRNKLPGKRTRNDSLPGFGVVNAVSQWLASTCSYLLVHSVAGKMIQIWSKLWSWFVIRTVMKLFFS